MLACKRLSWWGLKWNWHFQFVPWHVRLGPFTHSSVSPNSCNPPIRPPLFPPIFLSLSHYSSRLPLYKPPPPSISVGLSFGTPTVRQENMAQIPLSRIPNTSADTCERYTINMHFALGTLSKWQMPTNAWKTDSEACTENKKWGRKQARPRTIQFWHTCHTAAIISGHTCLTEMSLISPTVAVILA